MMAPETTRRHAEGRAQRVGDGVRLHQVPDAEGSHGGQAGKHDPQPAPAEAPLDVVHGPSRHGVAIVGDAVLHGQHRFSELGGHPDQTGHPHPEEGAGATGRNGGGDARDVAGANSRRQGRHERLIVRDVPRASWLVANDQRESQTRYERGELQAPEAKREEDALCRRVARASVGPTRRRRA